MNTDNELNELLTSLADQYEAELNVEHGVGRLRGDARLDPTDTPQARQPRQVEPSIDELVGDWLTLPEVADRLGIPPGRVKQLLRDRKLIAVRRPDGTQSVPAAFFDGHRIVKGLVGTLTLLFDCGFDEPESLRWLFSPDESLPGTPIQAITEHRGTEVTRRAQALQF